MAVFRRTMRVELDEEPVRPGGDLEARLEPEVEPVDMRQLTDLEAPILGARDQAQAAAKVG
jgi:hypothetical protein